MENDAQKMCESRSKKNSTNLQLVVAYCNGPKIWGVVLIMRCPFCGHCDQKVLDSRPGQDAESIRRRRECTSCGRRFTTHERAERPRLFVVKRGGLREDYSREKVFDSMRIAARKRPITVEALRAAATRIEHDLMADGEEEVSTRSIGGRVLRELAAMDTVAYVRFASVYQEFETVSDFAEMVERVQAEAALAPFRHLQRELIGQEDLAGPLDRSGGVPGQTNRIQEEAVI